MLDKFHYDQFRQQGYVVVPNFVTYSLVEQARERFDPLFRGEFETGIQPDEWNWQHGKSDPSLTRQICNGWKADRTIARLVLSQEVGKDCALLMNWDGSRINQDNVIWKPAGAKPLGFHQDNTYQQWIDPPSMVTCWMALDDTHPDGGTIEYVTGSHNWPVSSELHGFHAPEDYHEGLHSAAESLGVAEYEIVQLKVNAGDAVFHHGGTWHGSGSNRTENPRRSVVAHCMNSESRHHPTNLSPIYSRYKKQNSLELDESFFPVLWHKNGHRTAFLDRD